jgi:hypothetical protein
MNDPHIEALHYRIKHASTVDFENAPPVEHPGPGCSVRIENGEVKITMKDHHPTIEDARDAVEPFLHAWELPWGLCQPDEKFEFTFLNGELIERNPAPGVLSAQAAAYGVGTIKGVSHVRRAKYPDPPKDFGWNADVDFLFERYRTDGH